MRHILSLTLVMSLFTICLNAQILKEAAKILNQSSGFSEKEASEGIKEALTNGTNNSVTLVSKVNGYFKNSEIKIPFPKDAKIVETKLRAIGLGKQVDNVVLALNRAAENAAKEAAPIFIAAIKNMTITDAINIVKGDNNAATKYLEKSTNAELIAKFQPIIKKSLGKVDATKYWSKAMSSYNKLPFVNKINPDLNEYVTNKAIEGLFVMIAKEELKIRQNPVAQTTELLKKVFGK
jgi:nitrogen regulatory protein PII